MRLHRNLVFAVIDGLSDIFNNDKYADKVVQSLLKRDKRWGARDRGFIAETTYEMVRWRRLYAEIADVKQPFSREDLWRMFAVWAVLRGVKLPDWPQLAKTPSRRIKGKFEELSKIRKFKESIPDWLDALGEKELGRAVWDKEIAALNEQADLVVRTNTLKGTKQDLKKAFKEIEIETDSISGSKEALLLKERSNIFTTELFKNGLFEVQDASSQLVATFADPKPGNKVVDACAGAGGKTLHLAALMENQGQIIALDIYQNKLKELKRRARRAGAHNITPKWIENNKVIKKLHGKADIVLIDAPCSGLGVLKRNPDAKWKLTPEFLDNIKETQEKIISDYSKMVKPGGSLVYATCSILPSENQLQINKFLDSEIGKDFIFVSDRKILAHETGFDGFYMAMLKKNN
ncbi:RsmB/NOP family class I SAM-dependent RNA methyltransferase [Spongiivirga citrea]|uniref:Class I SAM-dependent methyltransferase n=1 Tax=Spongiivirga citrea TaxID=1481457 RepID=A0A6M0CKK8_9FLAO|nr:RsmB/NOP family class I SAM-dependent RNA methyltransferase [Spongiivirga citrea]NER18495.1 class I SAM-dependent methyltransferase [Spongiivirga citrea]